MNLQQNEVNKTNEFNDSKYFFRAFMLDVSSISDSQLEGLKRRYPKAWLNRKSYPFFNHTYTKKIDLKQEYRFNLCYCLNEFAREDQNLMKELMSFLEKDYKQYANYLKNNSKDKSLFSEALLKLLLTIINGYDIPDRIKILSLIEALMEKHQLDFPIDIKKEYVTRFNESSDALLRTFNDKLLIRLGMFTKPLRTKQGEVYQFLNTYYKKLSETLDQPVANYIKQEASLLLSGKRYISIDNPNEVLVDAKGSFNVMIQESFLTSLTQNEVFEVLAAMAFSCSIEPSYDGEMPTISDDTWEKLLSFAQKNIIIYVIEYLLAKTQQDNRELFYKLTDTSDLISLRKLEAELKEVKKELKQEKQQRKELAKDLMTSKSEQSKAITQATSEKEKRLIEANRTISKQAQENEELKEELEKYKALNEILQAQLSEQMKKRVSDEPTELTSDDLSRLNQSSILFVGGHPNVVKRLQIMLPLAKFFKVDKNFDAQFSKDIKQVFILSDYVNHGMVYHVNKFISAPKRILSGTNVDYLLKECLNILNE